MKQFGDDARVYVAAGIGVAFGGLGLVNHSDATTLAGVGLAGASLLIGRLATLAAGPFRAEGKAGIGPAPEEEVPAAWRAWRDERAALLAEADQLLIATRTAVRDGREGVTSVRAARFADRAMAWAESAPNGELIVEIVVSSPQNIPMFLASQRPVLEDPSEADQMGYEKVWRQRFLVEHVPPPEPRRPT